MPFVENSQQATKERVMEGSISDTAMELMNRLHLLGNGSTEEELSWLCTAINSKYNEGDIESIYGLPDILLAKVIEHNDGKLLSCAAIIAKALHLPVFEAKKAIEALEE